MNVGVYYATYGHWTLALQQAGFNIKWQFQPNIKDPEKTDRRAQEILEANFPSVPYKTGSADFICGSPPCIGLSHANTKAGLDHWANVNFVEAFKFIGRRRPMFFLIEITPRILTMGKPLLERALTKVKGYDVHFRKFQIAEYGSPCKRKRVYILGARDRPWTFNILYGLPGRPSVGCASVLERFREKWDSHEPDKVMAYPMLNKHGEPLKGIFGTLHKRQLKPDEPTPTITGTTYRDVKHYALPTYKPKGRPCQVLKSELPSPTIHGQSFQDMLHYEVWRFLSIPEIQALMGFPDDYEFNPGKRKMKCQDYCKFIASGVEIRFTKYLLEYLKANFPKPMHKRLLSQLDPTAITQKWCGHCPNFLKIEETDREWRIIHCKLEPNTRCPKMKTGEELV